MNNLLRRVEDFLAHFRDIMETSGFTKKLVAGIDALANLMASKIMPLVEWLNKTLDVISDSNGDFWGDLTASLGHVIWEALKAPFKLLGAVLGFGFRAAFEGTRFGDWFLGSEGADDGLIMRNWLWRKRNRCFERLRPEDRDRQNVKDRAT